MTAGYLNPDVCYLAWLAALARHDRRTASAHAYDLFYWITHDGSMPGWTPSAKRSFMSWCVEEKPWLPAYLRADS